MSTEIYPVASETGFVRSLTLGKVCDWCYADAVGPVSKITDEFGLSSLACNMHGTEWFPEIYPESDTTDLVNIVWPYGEGRPNPVGVDTPDSPVPWYPLMSHRQGLRMNDPGSLASAFIILALEGRTAHHSSEWNPPAWSNQD